MAIDADWSIPAAISMAAITIADNATWARPRPKTSRRVVFNRSHDNSRPIINIRKTTPNSARGPIAARSSIVITASGGQKSVSAPRPDGPTAMPTRMKSDNRTYLLALKQWNDDAGGTQQDQHVFKNINRNSNHTAAYPSWTLQWKHQLANESAFKLFGRNASPRPVSAPVLLGHGNPVKDDIGPALLTQRARGGMEYIGLCASDRASGLQWTV